MEARSNVDAQVEQPAPIMPAVAEPVLAAKARDAAAAEDANRGHQVNDTFDHYDPPVVHDIPATDEAALRAREKLVNEREVQLDLRQPRPIEHLTDKTVESQIVSEFAVCAYRAYADQPNITPEAERALKCTTIYVMVLRNGFPIVGTAVAAAPENFDLNEGRKEARADALARLWQCEEYSLRNRLLGIDYAPDATGRNL